MNRYATFFLIMGLTAIGFYGMFAMWREFGGDSESNEIGVWVSGLSWGGAALIALIELWKQYNRNIKSLINNTINSAQNIFQNFPASSRSKKAYKELLKLKTLEETGIITKEYFDQEVNKLKKDIV